MEKKIDTIAVTRDVQGGYEHADLPSYDEGDMAKFQALVSALGLEMQHF
ncbi:hypothetical protein [Janthinobacterium lividum]|nr:hypothetical protein [Janthinobacterium lividum]